MPIKRGLSVDGMENVPQRSRSFLTSRPNRLPWCPWACTARGALGSVGLGAWSQNAQLLIQADTVLVGPSLYDLPMGNPIDVDAGERDDLLGGGETEEGPAMRAPTRPPHVQGGVVHGSEFCPGTTP